MTTRSRLLKPDLFKNSDLYDAEAESGLPVRLAYAGLWCASDRLGRFQWKPRELKVDVLPHDSVDFSKVLDVLVLHGFVVRYVVDGKEFGHIPTFPKHQKPHPREAQSTIPDPPEDVPRPRLGAPKAGQGVWSVETETETETHTELESETETKTARPSKRPSNGAIVENLPPEQAGVNVATAFPEFQLFREKPAHRATVETWLTTVPTNHYGRIEFLAETNKALQEGLTDSSVLGAMKDWIAKQPHDPGRGLWVRYLKKALKWQRQDNMPQRVGSSGQLDPSQYEALAALGELKEQVTQHGGFRHFAKPQFDALPDATRRGIKAMGGLREMFEGDPKTTQARFIEGYTHKDPARSAV